MLASTLVTEASLGRNAALLLQRVNSVPRPLRSHRVESSYDGGAQVEAEVLLQPQESVKAPALSVATPAPPPQPSGWAHVPPVVKPTWRGLLHRWAAFVAFFAGSLLVHNAPNDNAKLAASIYTGGMVAMVRLRSCLRGRGAGDTLVVRERWQAFNLLATLGQIGARTSWPELHAAHDWPPTTSCVTPTPCRRCRRRQATTPTTLA